MEIAKVLTETTFISGASKGLKVERLFYADKARGLPWSVGHIGLDALGSYKITAISWAPAQKERGNHGE